jgi:hypothetical protein
MENKMTEINTNRNCLNPDSPDFEDFPEKTRKPIYKCSIKSSGILIPDYAV